MVLCVPWVTLWRRTWKGSVLAVWTWLSFRKISHMFIKLTICGRNQTFSFSFLLHTPAALCISYHRDRPQAPSWDTSLVAARRGELSFPPRFISVISAWWGGRRASHKHAYMTHLVGLGIARNSVISFSVSSFTLWKTCWFLSFQNSSWGNAHVSQKVSRRPKTAQFPSFSFPLVSFFFSSWCDLSFFITMVPTS